MLVFQKDEYIYVLSG